MSELRKKGDVPLSPKDRHTLNIGTGNYNRFAPLLPPPSGRGRLNSKRKLDDATPPITPKTLRLDANVVFAHLKGSEDAVSEVRASLTEALKAGESCYSANDGGMGEAFFKLSKTVDLLIENQERILSTVVDALNIVGKSNVPSSYASAAAAHGRRQPPGENPGDRAPVNPAEQKVRKLRQAISKAERSVTLFNLDLGSVPVINRDTLNRKVTLLLHERAQREGIYKGNPAAAEEAMDDILSCASIDILGKGSRPFFNKKDNNDARNGKMCTVPIKLTFKDKKTRFQAELTLKKVCKIKCGTPYPKKLRSIMDELVTVCKSSNPGCFILTKVDTEKMIVTAKARNDAGWVDLKQNFSIPHDILDQAELAAISEDEVIDMVTIS